MAIVGIKRRDSGGPSRLEDKERWSLLLYTCPHMPYYHSLRSRRDTELRGAGPTKGRHQSTSPQVPHSLRFLSAVPGQDRQWQSNSSRRMCRNGIIKLLLWKGGRTFRGKMALCRPFFSLPFSFFCIYTRAALPNNGHQVLPINYSEEGGKMRRLTLGVCIRWILMSWDFVWEIIHEAIYDSSCPPHKLCIECRPPFHSP